MKKKRPYFATRLLFSLLAVMTTTTTWALTPLDGDVWDEETKTLTVNSNPRDMAYEGKTEIVNLVISSGVTSIGAYAFQDCSSLTSVTIPNSVTNIPYSTFRGCSSLTSIEIPNSVTKIGDDAFYGCSSLTSVSFPIGLTSIGSSAFSGCI